MSRVRMLVLALSVGAPLGARAVDAPHDAPPNCTNCHMGHNATGGSLTRSDGNFNLCQSCHLDTRHTGNFGFPWAESDLAQPGVSGRSHRWDADASNLGATPPSLSSSDPAEKAMAQHLDAGKLTCATCHDVHQADTVAHGGRGRQHVSAPKKTVVSAGTGTLAVSSVPATLPAKAYVLQFTAAGAVGTAQFRVSNDYEINWGPSVTTAASVPLADGVVLAFGGSFVLGDEYAFYVSYPYLRVSNAGSAMCVACHKDRDMRWQDVQGGSENGHSGGVKAVTLGTTVFHHPVAQALSKPLDRTAATMLDAHGSAQAKGNGDGDTTNDLTLSGGSVTCLTCHAVHNVDSNSLTPDPH